MEDQEAQKKRKKKKGIIKLLLLILLFLLFLGIKLDMDNKGYLYRLIYKSMEKQEYSLDSLQVQTPKPPYFYEDTLDQKKKSL
jgi:flagellar basal body-associated protein FliL